MDIYQLNTTLKSQARELGLCDEWYNAWHPNESYEELLKKFHRGIDFCIKNSWPSPEIASEFPRDILRKQGVIVHDDFSLLNPFHAVVMDGSHAIIRLNAWAKSQIYITDSSALMLTTKGQSTAYVHIFGHAKIKADAHDISRIVIFRHSETCKITTTGNATIKDELGYLSR